MAGTNDLLMIWSLWVVLRCTILILCLRLHGLVWRLFSFGLSSCLLLTLFSSSFLCILLDDICIANIKRRLYWYNSSIRVIDLVFLIVLLVHLLVLWLLVVFHFFLCIFVIFTVVMLTTLLMLLLPTRYNNRELL